MYKKLALAFSVANLCFFKAWRDVLSSEGIAYLYLWKQYPGSTALVALVFNVLALTAVFYFGFMLCWRYAAPFWRNCLRLAFLVIFLRSLNGVRIQFQSLGTGNLRLLFGRIGFLAIGLSLLAILIILLARYGIASVTRVAASVALVLSPFGLLALSQGTYFLIKYRALVSEERPSLPLLRADTNTRSRVARVPRVLWVIFDEMSDDVAFAHRPTDLALPEFDRLQSVALSATNAFPPAGRTLQSIPALLTGRLIAAVKPDGPRELLLTYDGQNTSARWSQEPDIFTATRSLGRNAAAVGWYHPYCRVIGDRLTKCFWQPASQAIHPEKLSTTTMMLLQESELLQLLPYMGGVRERIQAQVTRPDYRAVHLADYLALVEPAAQIAADPEINLAFVHLPVPHPPYIFDRKSGAWNTKGELGYLDNLALADRTLGQLRTAMERSGTWDETTVLVSSDHWWRTEYWQVRPPIWSRADDPYGHEKADHRIPFLVKLGGQKTSATYNAPFNTVLTHDLVLEILNGRVATVEQLSAWLDSHRSFGESPYQAYDELQ